MSFFSQYCISNALACHSFLGSSALFFYHMKLITRVSLSLQAPLTPNSFLFTLAAVLLFRREKYEAHFYYMVDSTKGKV